MQKHRCKNGSVLYCLLMSAIAGLLYKDGKAVEEADLERMSAALAAYGPEGGGIWRQKAVGLVHRQTCVTLEDSSDRQPACSPDAQVVLVSAGRIDNRPELASKLSLPAEWPDSQFILAAYLRWGTDSPKHLIGDYTFGVWDESKWSLLLARSPFSARPLYYHDSDRFFAFAAMPKGLFALPMIPRALDENTLAHSLARAPRPSDSTFYSGIKSLLPGHLLTVQDGHVQARAFWEPDYSREVRYANDEECVEAFSELWSRVVADHIRGVSPPGIMLGGGLDSSAVAAIAAPLLNGEGKRLTAFTEVPRFGYQTDEASPRYAEETPYVEALAKMYDAIDLHLIRTDGIHFLKDINQYFQHAEAPFRNACNRMWYEAILRAAQSQGVKTLLTGGQGNLTISWKGEPLLPGLLRRGQWAGAIQETQTLARSSHPIAVLKALLSQGVFPLLPERFSLRLMKIKDQAAYGPPLVPFSALHPAYARQHGIATRELWQQNPITVRSREDSRRLRCEVMQKSANGSGPIMAGYQAQYGIEIRDPTSDLRIIEFCLALPEEQFRSQGVSRRLIRRAMAGRLPDEILTNPRRGLQAADWAERMVDSQVELREALVEMEESDLVRDLIDLKALRGTLDQLCRWKAGRNRGILEFRNYLEAGFMTGSFIRWFETGGQ